MIPHGISVLILVRVPANCYTPFTFRTSPPLEMQMNASKLAAEYSSKRRFSVLYWSHLCSLMATWLRLEPRVSWRTLRWAGAESSSGGDCAYACRQVSQPSSPPTHCTTTNTPTTRLYRVAQNKQRCLLLLSKFCICTTKHASMIMCV